MTANERFLQCMSVGGDETACHELVLEESVNGVWCDGTIYYDASGKRCIPRQAVEARQALTVHAETTPVAQPSGGSWVTWAMVAAIAVLAYIELREGT